LAVITTRQPEVRLIGKSPSIQALEMEIESASKSDAKVLITGETGVGKEVVSRLIHHRSARAAAASSRSTARVCRTRCSNRNSSATCADRSPAPIATSRAFLEMAPNGTVFLDEVGEMSTRMQVVLLRFLESGEIQRVGADRSHTRVNVRLITATNRDLQAQINPARSAKISTSA
jgi:anaerobic nitric oxide reductase transcription regulator